MTVRPQTRVRAIGAAMAVDALGSGLFGPFGLLYGHAVVGLPLTQAGLVLSVTGAVGLAAGPVAGATVDRYGAARVVVVSNLLSALGGVGLLVAHDVAGYALASLAGFVGARGYWAAFAPLVGEVAEPARLETWFGRLRAVRYVGVTAGAALASAVLLLGERTGLRLMVTVDAVTYAVAGLLVLWACGWAASHATRPEPSAGDAPAGSYRTALGDRANVATAGLNVLCTLLCLAPVMALPVIALGQLDLDPWVPGALAATIAGALTVSVLVSPRLAHGRRRLVVLAAACTLWVVGCGTLAVATRTPEAWLLALLVVGAAVLGVAEGVHAPAADAVPLALAPVGLAGRYTALHQLAWGISAVVAPGLTAVLLTAGPTLLWLVLGGLSLVAAAGYALVQARAGTRTGRVGEGVVAVA